MSERLWDAGDNKAVDLAVVANGRLLLVRRDDGGGWAIPGGFVEPGETDLDAMVRELHEETSVVVNRCDVRILTDRIVVDDPRNEPDRWITTVLGLVVLPHAVEAVGSDDAAEACWVPMSALSGVGLYPAHRPLIDEVVKAMAR